MEWGEEWSGERRGKERGFTRDGRSGSKARFGLVEAQRRLDIGKHKFVRARIATGSGAILAVLRTTAVFGAEFLGPCSNEFLRGATITSHLDHLFLNFFPYTRYTEKKSGAYIFHRHCQGPFQGIRLAEIGAGT